ncbi:MAG: peptidoglycan editing factor PgeF [Chlorobium sp.]|nr:MAG: peptidoglycan editing factor PgeF [Chlorobium sp.]
MISDISAIQEACNPEPSEYIIPEIFRNFPELVALQSTRTGGVSEGVYASLNLGTNTGDRPECVHENTRRLCAAAGIDPEKMVRSEQVHGTEILVAEKPGAYHGYDAFITNKENLFLSVFTADCYPILVFDPRHNASGAIHAGWKGTAGEIVLKTIDTMQKNYGSRPSECLAWIGTGISGDAYEVSREVTKAFRADESSPSHFSANEEKYLLDLGQVNFRQLLDAGMQIANIERSSFCSYRDSSLFFSYRRDKGTTGRMVSLIGVGSKTTVT